jgi:hypothetical protein
MKSIQADVQLVVEHLVVTLGGTWQAALVPRVQICAEGQQARQPAQVAPAVGGGRAPRCVGRFL